MPRWIRAKRRSSAWNQAPDPAMLDIPRCSDAGSRRLRTRRPGNEDRSARKFAGSRRARPVLAGAKTPSRPGATAMRYQDNSGRSISWSGSSSDSWSAAGSRCSRRPRAGGGRGAGTSCGVRRDGWTGRALGRLEGRRPLRPGSDPSPVQFLSRWNVPRPAPGSARCQGRRAAVPGGVPGRAVRRGQQPRAVRARWTEDVGDIEVRRPAGGMTSALDPLLQAVGGIWIAWGAGMRTRSGRRPGAGARAARSTRATRCAGSGSIGTTCTATISASRTSSSGRSVTCARS